MLPGTQKEVYLLMRMKIALSVVATACMTSGAAEAATYTVVKLEDTCASPSSGTLRYAIQQANASPGSDLIKFLVGPGQQLQLECCLPRITVRSAWTGT